MYAIKGTLPKRRKLVSVTSAFFQAGASELSLTGGEACDW
jgi:hypothetical protein